MLKGFFLLLLSLFVAKEPIKENKIVVPEEVFVIPINKITPTIAPVQKRIVLSPTPEVWGVAKQLNEVTWTMKIENDKRMGSPKEILSALNEYRRRKGVSQLMWDDNLAKLAQSRAEAFDQIKSTDKHEGFKKYIDNDGFEKLGFTWVGENSSFGYRLEGVHLIEWVFAGDKPHDDNQTNSRWNYVGIGTKGLGVDIIFGTGKK